LGKINNNDKIEIKIQSKTSFYFDLIKKNMTKLLRGIVGVLILAGTLYIGFYLLFLFIVIFGVSYIFNKLKS